MKAIFYLMLVGAFSLIVGCSKQGAAGNNLNIHFTFDSNQERLDSNGIVDNPNGNAGSQHIEVKRFAIARIEFNKGNDTNSSNALTFYKTEDTVINGVYVLNFPKLVWLDKTNNKLTIPIDNIPFGEYQFMKIVIAVIDYEITGQLNLSAGKSVQVIMPIKSFLGHACYIPNFNIGDSLETINNIRAQGFTVSLVHYAPANIHRVFRGSAKIVTAPNPIYKTSPTIARSGIITAAFLNKSVVINETTNQDIELNVSFSTNKAFEWDDNNKNGAFDVVPVYEPIANIGLRGMQPTVK